LDYVASGEIKISSMARSFNGWDDFSLPALLAGIGYSWPQFFSADLTWWMFHLSCHLVIVPFS